MKAKPIYQSALEITEKSQSFLYATTFCSNLAGLSKSDLYKSRTLFQKALEIKQNALGKSIPILKCSEEILQNYKI